MLVIKNTPAIQKLYGHTGLTIRAFDKTYLVSFQNRNDRRAEHLVITNYGEERGGWARGQVKSGSRRKN
jgi:DNA adenine methylase